MSEKPFGYPNNIRKVISETLTSDIRNICISDIQTYCTASIDIRKVANRVGLVCCNSTSTPDDPINAIVITDQGQSTLDSNIDHCYNLSDILIYCYR